MIEGNKEVCKELKLALPKILAPLLKIPTEAHTVNNKKL